MLIDELRFMEKPDFLTYLQSGWSLRLSLAIDFTGSNGNYTWPSSLHFLKYPN